MKKIVLFVLVVAMVFSLCACGQSEEKVADVSIEAEGATTGEDITIAMLVPHMGIGYYRQVCYGIVQACELYGADFVIKSGIESVDVQLQAIEDLIQSGVDGIIISPIDSYGLATALELCEKEGVALISQAELYGADTTATSVMATDNVMMGKSVAELCVADLNEKGNVVILKSGPGVANSEEKVEGMLQVFDEYPGIEVLEVKADSDDDNTGQTNMADLCQTYADIDAVLCVNEHGLSGAMISLEEAGYKLGENINTYSCNYSEKLSPHIQSGASKTGIFSWGNLFGEWSVQVIVKELAGEAVPSHVTLPSTLVTVDNYEAYDILSQRAMDFDFDQYEQ